MRPDQMLGLTAGRRKQNAPHEPLVATRRRASERLSDVLENGPPGPVLITGEPGAGKSWLADRLVADLDPARFPLRMRPTSAVEPLEFLSLIATELGIPTASSMTLPRWQIGQTLEDDAADGRHWIIVIDEPQRASAQVWEEIQALIDRLGRPGGFSGMIVTAATEFVGMLKTRPLGAFATSLAAHVHLMPLDHDETHELLAPYFQASPSDGPFLEDLHREARGNPRRLLRLAELTFRGEALHLAEDAGPTVPFANKERASAFPEPLTSDNFGPVTDQARQPPSSTLFSSSQSLIPAKPPIRVEEGLVEVGWDGELGELGEPSGSESLDHLPASVEAMEHEAGSMEDHAAVLRAWTNWTLDREPIAEHEAEPHASGERRQPELVSRVPGGYDRADSFEAAPTGRSANVRAEVSQEFAPYSHLFARSRESKQE
jgi:AAA domain